MYNTQQSSYSFKNWMYAKNRAQYLHFWPSFNLKENIKKNHKNSFFVKPKVNNSVDRQIWWKKKLKELKNRPKMHNTKLALNLIWATWTHFCHKIGVFPHRYFAIYFWKISKINTLNQATNSENAIKAWIWGHTSIKSPS